ncbi:InlB B-repeat-containing protein [Paenibacillus puerhi]|uniref:InlB B-repeat-containing protein n=1 Tax=Paenibacillus puerhi TaxID=2692622 RepID=UPI001914FF2D|nr:InlB B-repeat-containing protein [Paenibacillus puerhi]
MKRYANEKQLDQLKHIYLAIQSLQEEALFGVQLLCEMARIPRSSYYKWLNRKPSAREQENEQLTHVMMSIATGYVPPFSGTYIEFMKYGERLNVPSYVTNIAGLTFLGWESIDEVVPAETKTYTAYFDVKKDMRVLVKFYSRDSYEEPFSKVGSEIYLATAFTEFNARLHAAGYYNSPNEYALADDWGLPTDYIIRVSPSNSKNLVVKQYLDRKYELKFDLGGGTFTDNTPQIIYLPAENAYDIPPDPVREGYKFAGWSPAIPSAQLRLAKPHNTAVSSQQSLQPLSR